MYLLRIHASFFVGGGGVGVVINKNVFLNFVLSLCNEISISTFDLLFAILVPPQSENASYSPVLMQTS